MRKLYKPGLKDATYEKPLYLDWIGLDWIGLGLRLRLRLRLRLWLI